MDRTQKASKGTVSVESFQSRLRLRLPRQLYEGTQKYLTLNLADTPENCQLAEQKAYQIELDIASGSFDETLAKYKPQRHLSIVTPGEQ
ncbi:DUF3596 domain-containing protein [Nostoc sp. CHAB 5715]|uniref:Arm DNA-binding domain-containing protein n=1 Tax=Nostoc sp. CHAB 5715 TaxID=2780400 RepID=UPI001E596BE2|nr:DUF3596 domain-containing protein [Nostoc sp. CHAB 5715]MCC5624498.1 DUF3596 domain-containing protein [Nostoc sp. CHAB 5715]